ncbi:ATP-dependent RNA helicase/nuclease Hef [Halalkaliarchaeum desulfuricum]|uniref:ATP-dependent RNA helicase/nuclease Hef n=1 Tax=Halalkaliarchaeum desulfuricum TaxID=2055893 RepID=A0A343TFL6_9EURY|nr:DEAD/DEAH box helicase [Halalkaliarchaeum desulfuricum]AUX07888.1 ATP-dependent RNA helicase/nuclease Hef [Halalkaliarchaeum desulfuricum]
MAATEDVAYVDHPLLAPGLVERRGYQLELAAQARTEHTLVCLPTGLGKTTVSLLVTAERLHDCGGTALFLAPTKPLVTQHAEFYRQALSIPDDEIVVFTGEVSPDDRGELFERARIVIATPQVIENDLVGNRIDLADVTHLTFDECHRGTGDYSYVYIADRYHADADDPLVTAMSASPGGDGEEIRTVCENLGVGNVAVMTEEDADVDEYTHDTDVEWIEVELPETVIEIRDALNEVIEDRLEKLKSLGVTNTTSPDLSQKQLNRMRGKLQKMMDEDQSAGYKGISTHAEVMKLRRAVELVETQSVDALCRYFERQRQAARSSGASKASQRLVSEPKVREAMRKAESFDGTHPKFSRTRILLAETLGIGGGERVIVFTESRDTAEALSAFLGEHFDVHRFVGQGDKEGSDGMTQKQQAETLSAFRNGEFEVLVSTSVAEEGLDVPEVDLVLFFEPVPTAIRSIQRKGRTGRQAAGRVVVLMAKDTRDEAFFWIARRREQRMESELRELKQSADEIQQELPGESIDDSGMGGDDGSEGGDDGSEGADDGSEGADDGRRDGQPGLSDFATGSETTGDGSDDDSDENEPGEGDSDGEGGSPSEDNSDDQSDEEGIVATAESEEGAEIVIDQRELDSHIARELSTREGIYTRLETLSVGDYVLSDRVAVERKSVDDFLDTLTGGDRSLFEQAGDLARNYSRPVLILEGETDLYGARNVHPNAIRGALASLAIDFDVSVLRTDGTEGTANMLETIARREQEERDRAVSVHGEKGSKTLPEQQEYVVSAIADIGPITARGLLEAFGSVEAVMTAEKEDLLEIDGIGEVTADRIREVVASEYVR